MFFNTWPSHCFQVLFPMTISRKHFSAHTNFTKDIFKNVQFAGQNKICYMRDRMIIITGPVPYYSPSRPEMLKNENDDDLRACSRYKIFDHDFQQTMPCLSSCLRNTQFWIWTLTPFLMILF